MSRKNVPPEISHTSVQVGISGTSRNVNKGFVSVAKHCFIIYVYINIMTPTNAHMCTGISF